MTSYKDDFLTKESQNSTKNESLHLDDIPQDLDTAKELLEKSRIRAEELDNQLLEYKKRDILLQREEGILKSKMEQLTYDEHNLKTQELVKENERLRGYVASLIQCINLDIQSKDKSLADRGYFQTQE